MALDIVQGMLEIQPSGVSGLILHLDASDDSSITLVGNDVDQWDDLSGSGNHFVITDQSRPEYIASGVNNLNVVEFDSANTEGMNASTGAFISGVPFTLFVAYNTAGDADGANAAGASMTLLSITESTANENYFFFQSPRPSNSSFAPDVTNGTARGPNIPGITQVDYQSPIVGDNKLGQTSILYYSLLSDTVNMNPRLNNSNRAGVQRIIINNFVGSQDPDDTPGAFVPISLDSTSLGYFDRALNDTHMDGQICEVLMYNRTLPDDIVLKLHNYLANKWGVTIL